MAELLADIEGLPVLVRLLVQDIPAEMRSDLATDADIHSLLSSTLEKVVERMRGSPLRRDEPSKQPLAIVELICAWDRWSLISSIEPQGVVTVESICGRGSFGCSNT